jgi:short chain dehydrogenase
MTTNEKSMGKLEGKIALISGGNSGIGLATAKQFVNEGAYVFITGRRDPELAAAVKEIGRNVTGVQGDVSDLADIDRLFAKIKREKGKLDIVFANAGAARYAPFGPIRKAQSPRSRRKRSLGLPAGSIARTTLSSCVLPAARLCSSASISIQCERPRRWTFGLLIPNPEETSESPCCGPTPPQATCPQGSLAECAGRTEAVRPQAGRTEAVRGNRQRRRPSKVACARPDMEGAYLPGRHEVAGCAATGQRTLPVHADFNAEGSEWPRALPQGDSLIRRYIRRRTRH